MIKAKYIQLLTRNGDKYSIKMIIISRNRSLLVWFHLVWIFTFCLSSYSKAKEDEIKSDFGECTVKETKHNSFKETCHIKFNDDRSNRYIEKMQRKN